MTKKICDICGKVAPNYLFVTIPNKNAQVVTVHNYDICRKCLIELLVKEVIYDNSSRNH